MNMVFIIFGYWYRWLGIGSGCDMVSSFNKREEDSMEHSNELTSTFLALSAKPANIRDNDVAVLE